MTEQTSFTSSGPREVFLQLLSTVTLYMSASSLIGLWFSYLNFYFNTQNFPAEFYAISIRFHLALLMVAFPLYFYTVKKYRAWAALNPGLNQLRIKNWLIYLTLFLVALCIVIDLATLIYRFLGGDLSVSFLAKVVALLLVCGLIFYYYQNELKQHWQNSSLGFFASIISLIVIATLIYGFSLTGSPFKARLANFDTQRLVDLSGIQSQITNYWNTKHQLPSNLDGLTNSITGYKAPTDPQTKQAYDYAVLSKNSFQLCAQFNLASTDKTSNDSLFALGQGENNNWNWQHPAGKYCFTRTINP